MLHLQVQCRAHQANGNSRFLRRRCLCGSTVLNKLLDADAEFLKRRAKVCMATDLGVLPEGWEAGVPNIATRCAQPPPASTGQWRHRHRQQESTATLAGAGVIVLASCRLARLYAAYPYRIQCMTELAGTLRYGGGVPRVTTRSAIIYYTIRDKNDLVLCRPRSAGCLRLRQRSHQVQIKLPVVPIRNMQPVHTIAGFVM